MIKKQNLLVTLEAMPCEMLDVNVISKADVLEYVEANINYAFDLSVISNAPWKSHGYMVSTPLYLSRFLQQPVDLDVSMIWYYFIALVYKKKFLALCDKANLGQFLIDKIKDAVVHATYFKTVLCESEARAYEHCGEVASDFSTDMVLNLTEKCCSGWFIAHEMYFAVVHEFILLLQDDDALDKITRVMKDKRLAIVSRERSVSTKLFPLDARTDFRSGLPVVTVPVPHISIT
jgi:hypothetical protein